jgi:hypothetical protein
VQALRPALQCKHGDTPDIWRRALATLIRVMDAALPALVRQTEGTCGILASHSFGSRLGRLALL